MLIYSNKNKEKNIMLFLLYYHTLSFLLGKF